MPACEEPQIDEVLHLDQHGRPRRVEPLHVHLRFEGRGHVFPATGVSALIIGARIRDITRKAISALTFISWSPGDWTFPALGPERYQLRSVSTAMALLKPGWASPGCE